MEPVTKSIKSFRYSWKGLKAAAKGRNFRFELFWAALALVLSFVFNIFSDQLAIIVLTITIVLALEIVNTCVEEMCNKFHPDTHPHIALIKDLAAGAALVSVIGAIIVGLIIFLPYL